MTIIQQSRQETANPVEPCGFDQVFERLVRNRESPVAFSESGWNPNIDVSESDSEVVVKAEIPGVSPEEVNISVEDNRVVISGEKEQESKEEDGKYYRVERSYGSFIRSLSLPPGADSDGIKASSKDGVLSIVIPKGKDAKSRVLEIRGTRGAGVAAICRNARHRSGPAVLRTGARCVSRVSVRAFPKPASS